MEKDYFVTYAVRGQPLFLAAVARISFPPHEEPKGTNLEDLCVDAVYEQNPQVGSPDSIDLYSACELPAAPWCIGHTREVVIGGRCASLEAGPAGWRIHL